MKANPKPDDFSSRTLLRQKTAITASSNLFDDAVICVFRRDGV